MPCIFLNEAHHATFRLGTQNTTTCFWRDEAARGWAGSFFHAGEQRRTLDKENERDGSDGSEVPVVEEGRSVSCFGAWGAARPGVEIRLTFSG